MKTALVRTLLCPNCGAPIRHGDLECDYCGSALYAEHAAEITVPAVAHAQQIIPEMQARIKRNPYDGQAYYELGLACFTLKLYDQAESAFVQAERFSPGSALTFYFAGLARLWRAEAEILSVSDFRIRQMRQDFETALSLDPNLAEAQLYHRLTDALLARNHADYAEAVPPLREVVQAIPKLALAYKLLAACYFQTTEYTLAIEAGIAAWKLNEKDEDVAYLIGTSYGRLHEENEMRLWAQRIAELRGDPGVKEEMVREFRGEIG